MPSRRLTDHVLRTFASVPTTARILALGAGISDIATKLSLLGFDVVDRQSPDESLTAGSERSFDWAIAFSGDSSPKRIKHILGLIRPLIRSGGWVVVGVETSAGEASLAASAVAVETQLDSIGYGLAESSFHHAEGYHLIVRCVGTNTQA